MIQLTLFLLASISLFGRAYSDVSPEIIVVEEGYNIIAKIPCLGCPFLYQDTSQGTDEAWSQRKDENALLLNISLPYTSAHLSINTAQLLTTSSILPKVYANQVVQDLSVYALATALDSNQLEASHETSLGGGFFGLSYSFSLRHLSTSHATHSPQSEESQVLDALLFHFDIIELHSNQLDAPLSYKTTDINQKMLEVVLLQRPVLSALQPSASFEIVKASLVLRTHNRAPTQQTMHFHEWDGFGKKGTAAHAVTSLGNSFIDYISSGVWALFIFCFSLIALFVVVCVFCIFGCSFWQDEYASAQSGKRRGTGSKGSRARGASGKGWNDPEMGKPKGRFLAPEELGIVGRGRVVGIGKSD